METHQPQSLLPDIHEGDTDEEVIKTPDAPPYSPISLAGDAASLCDITFEDSSAQDEQGPGYAEPESFHPSVSNFLLIGSYM